MTLKTVQLVFLCLLVILGSGVFPSSAQVTNGSVCAESCQTSQRASLVQLYNLTAAIHWNNSDGWLSDATTNNTLPSHCSWFGVACCLNGQLDSASFPSTALVPCIVSGGVSALLLNRNNLTGPMDQVAWAALAPSLQYLDLSGLPNRVNNRFSVSIPFAVLPPLEDNNSLLPTST